MADSFIQVAPDSTGKQMQTYLATISGNPVHAEAVVLVSSAQTPLGTTGDALNVSVASGINVNASFSNAVNVQQSNASNLLATVSQGSGAWYLAAINSAVTVVQPNASNFLATVSGTVATTQSGTWNIGTLATVTNPVTAVQTNASNFNATVGGTVTVNAGTNLNTSLLATSPKQTDGSQKTQINDPINVSNVAGVTAGGLNVYLPSITANSGTNLNTANISVKAFQAGAFLASGQIIIGNISTTIAGARATRRSATIRNQDTSNSGYIGPAPIGTANGLLLYPGDSISVDFVGVIAGISLNTTNAGNVTFGYLETYD